MESAEFISLSPATIIRHCVRYSTGAFPTISLKVTAKVVRDIPASSPKDRNVQRRPDGFCQVHTIWRKITLGTASNLLIGWWAQQDSNLRLPPCEGGTLPLSYAPNCLAAAAPGELTQTTASNGFIIPPSSGCHLRPAPRSGTFASAVLTRGNSRAVQCRSTDAPIAPAVRPRSTPQTGLSRFGRAGFRSTATLGGRWGFGRYGYAGDPSRNGP